MPTSHHVTRALLSCRQAVLASQSAGVPGFPYASVIPVCTTRQGQIISLLNENAPHSKNIALDSRVSLLLHDDLEQNWQAATRLSVIGHMRPLRADRQTTAQMRATFDLLHPELSGLSEHGDTRLWRLESVRFRFESPLGRIYWLDNIETDLFELTESERIVLNALLAARNLQGQVVHAGRHGLQIVAQGQVRFLTLNEPVDALAELLEQMNADQYDDPAYID